MTLALAIAGAVGGGLFGYGVAHFIACDSGVCPLTSNPWYGSILGMVTGALTLS